MEKLTVLSFITLCILSVSRSQPNGRIVGGLDAADGQFPYQISLRMDDSHICGGSIISRNYILTAAHCVGDEDENDVYSYHVYQPELLTIRAGSTNRLMGGVLRQVVEITVHEMYDGTINDIALLKLDSPLVFSQNIKAIALATSETPVGSGVIVSGWGDLKTNGDSPIKLQWTTLQTMSRLKCFTSTEISSDALICLAHAEGNGGCSGDSGGPATFNGELIGVGGFVIYACGTNNPDGFAKVYYHLNWIKEHSDV